jgi:hypothetical protein
MVIVQIQKLDLSKNYSVDIIEKKHIRTIPQNRLYRLWLVCIGFETGNDPDVLHEFFKEKYLEPEEIIIFNSKVKKYTTTNLNTVQFKNYLDKIQAFSLSELSITLPNPEDKYWEEFLNYYQDKL